MKSVVLGIDFGTSNSICCMLDGKGCPRVLDIRTEAANVPSIVILNDVTKWFGTPAKNAIGGAAKRAATTGQMEEFRNLLPNVFRNFKRRVGMTRPIRKLASGRSIRTVDLVTLYIHYLLDGAGLLDGQTAISALCLTHPVGFSSGQILELREALYRNGFCREIRMIPEPIAAVMGYEATHESLKQNCGIVVFDFGGGTLDVAYVMRDASGRLVARRENAQGHRLQVGENIGGADIDMLVYQIAEQQMGQDSDDAIKDPFLEIQCQEIKERLSRKEQDQSTILQTTEKLVNGVPQKQTKAVQFSISRKEFLDALNRDVRILPGLKRTLKSVLNAVAEDSELAPVDCLLPIGGSCRMPVVQDLLKAMLPEGATLGELVPDDTAVAMGAAIEAGRTSPVEQIAKFKQEFMSWVNGVVMVTGL